MDTACLFRPPAPVPLPCALGPIALLKTLRRNPLECWTRAHFEQPVVIGGFPFGQVAVVSDPSIIRHVFVECPSDYRKGAIERRVLSSAELGDSLVAVEGAQWRRQRRTLAPLLGRKMVAGLAPAMAEAISAVIGSWRSRNETADRVIDLKAEMSRVSLEVLVRCMFSPDLGEDQDNWRAALKKFFAAKMSVDPFDIIGLPDFVPRIVRWRARRMLRGFTEGIDGAMARRRNVLAEGRDFAARDGLALMLGATDPETGARMSEAEVRTNLLAFFFAGQETTSTVLTWTFYLLSQSPEWYGRLTAEARSALDDGPIEQAVDRLAETRAVVEEAMRLYPPIVGITRSAAAGTRLGPHTLNRRTMVIVSPYVVHRHRLLWTDPDVFDPRRFLSPVNRYAYLPFGIGPRMCIGAAFAMQETILAVAMVLKSFSIHLASGHAVWPVHRLTLRPRDPLLMVTRPVEQGRMQRC